MRITKLVGILHCSLEARPRKSERLPPPIVLVVRSLLSIDGGAGAKSVR